MGIVEAVGSEVDAASQPGDRVVIPFNISCGHCWMCDQRPAVAVRDDAGARAGQGRGAVRLHEALRPGPGRPGRAAARAAGALRPDQGARGSARRALPVPLRRPADRVAGGRVRRDPRGRHASPSSASGPIGQMAPHRRAPRRRAGARHRPGPRAARAGARATASRRSTSREHDDVAARCASCTERPRARLRHRRRRHGGARRADRQARADRCRAAARRGRRAS